jgi:hypothetical protein
MSRQLLMTVVLLAAGLAAGVALMNLTSPAAAQPADGGGTYRVVPGTNSYVLVDTVKGTAWVIFPKAEDMKHAWFPITRLDTEADIRKWKITKGAEPENR